MLKYFARSAGIMCEGSRRKITLVRSKARATNPEQINSPSNPNENLQPVSKLREILIMIAQPYLRPRQSRAK